jgi:uncharacterized repeat protein (TIGR01451 family)
MTPRPALVLLVGLLAVGGLSATARASGGSFATTGTGTYAASLWWLDFTGFNNTTAMGGGQPFSFTLPGGVGTLSTTVVASGNGTLAAVAEPAWTAGGAFGHGAYGGLTGAPIFYWVNQPGNLATVSLTALRAADAGGNVRAIGLYAADGENTNSGESITYTSTKSWSLVETVNNYADYNGGVPAYSGTGTTTVTESPPTGANTDDNASLIFGTANPSSVAVAVTNNEGVLFAVSIPTVSLTVKTTGRSSSTDQFTATIAYTSPAYTVKTASTSGSATSATTGAVSVFGNNSLTLSASMLAGSGSALGYYVGSMACTNSGPGAASFSGAPTVLPSGTGTSFTLTPQGGDAIACTLTLSEVTETIAGTVYADANHDAALDNGETATGLANLYVVLETAVSGVCQTPALSAAAVTAATGAYTLSGVTPGSYCLTLTGSSSLTSVAAVVPSGYIATEAPGGVRQVGVGATPVPAQNFGLYNGSTLTATVFADTGTGGGTANDGVENGAEAGIANVVVAASAGATALSSATTNGSGVAQLWLPASTVGSKVTLTPTAPTGDLATGGSAGTTGGSFTRPSVGFTAAAGLSYTGVAFGYIPPSSLIPNGALTAPAGTTLYYPHSVTVGSAGQLGFTISATASPATSGWTQVLYQDLGCSGQFASGDRVIGTALAVTAGQQICLLVEQFVPAGAPTGTANKITLNATLTYGGTAAPAASLLSATDVTTVTAGGATQLSKQVENLNVGSAYGTANTALPGDTLQYQLTLKNTGSAALATVVVDDTTPSYTTFLSAACPASLPTGLTACSVTTQPAVGGQGALQWTFTGTLGSGAQAAVTYQVVVSH